MAGISFALERFSTDLSLPHFYNVKAVNGNLHFLTTQDEHWSKAVCLFIDIYYDNSIVERTDELLLTRDCRPPERFDGILVDFADDFDAYCFLRECYIPSTLWENGQAICSSMYLERDWKINERAFELENKWRAENHILPLSNTLKSSARPPLSFGLEKREMLQVGKITKG